MPSISIYFLYDRLDIPNNIKIVLYLLRYLL